MKLEHQYSTFAIDTLPCRMCHASAVLPVTDDRLLCAFFGGSYEGESDVGIYLCMLDKGVHIKHSFIKVSNEAHWNPVLFCVSEDRLALFFKVGNIIAQWSTFVCYSSDGGENWSEPVPLIDGDKGGRGPVRNPPLRLKSGRILCPASSEQGEWHSFVDISDDNLMTLEKSADIYADHELIAPRNRDLEKKIAVSEQSYGGQGIIQPALWEDSSGVHMLLRSTFGRILRSDSLDEGQNWCKPYAVNMPNNNSGIATSYYKDTLFLACNPVADNWGARTPMTLFTSENGIDFKEAVVLETQKAEFSYPCLYVLNNSLYISYTSKRTNIRIHKYNFV